MKHNQKSIKDQVNSKLEDISEVKETKKEEKLLNAAKVEVVEDGKIQIDNQLYTIVANYRDAVDAEAIAKRYNSIFNKYDYVVGDWGYDQLRLKGFFHDKNARASQDKKISFLEDYLYEYCNFGCAYFVLEKDMAETKKAKNKRKRKRQKSNGDTEVVENATKVTESKPDKKKNFVIKQTSKNKNQEKPKRNKSNGTDEAPKTSFQILEIED